MKHRTMDQAINDRLTVHLANIAADEAMNFKIGDQVVWNGMVGTIDTIELFEGSNMYSVSFNPGRWAYRATELKRA